MLKKFSLVVSISALALLLVAVTVSAKVINADPSGTTNPPAPVIGPNLLNNPGMEGHYNQQCSAIGTPPWVQVPCDPTNFDNQKLELWATAQVPYGWSAWWRIPNNDFSDPNYYNDYPAYCDYTKKAADTCVPWHNPEFRDTAGGPQETGPERRMEGDNSQKYFTFYTIHEAGLYQVVGGIKPGQRVRFSAYMEAWSSNANDPNHSEGQPTMGMQVGIDPYGGNNPWSANIIWAPVQESFDKFSLFAVEAVARNKVVSVWTKSRPYFPQQHNDVYVDAASLNAVGTVAPVVNRTTSKFTTRVVTTTKVITSSNGLTRTVVTTSTIAVPITPTRVVTTTKVITSSTGVTRTVITTSTVAIKPTFVSTNTTTIIAPNEYVVKRGDSLRAIAKTFGLHWADIAALNPVIQPPDYKIFVGQVIRLK
jgi:LysM repeat protein